MLKCIRQFLLFCLISLQFIAPFIHAHAFGHESFNEHTFHVHADEIPTVVYNQEAIQATHINQQHLVGTIFTVASGIKQAFADDVSDDIALMAIVFSLVLLIFNVPSKFASRYNQLTKYQRIVYSQQNPRAPPR